MPRHNNGPYIKLNDLGYWEIRWTEGGRSRRLSTATRDRDVAQEALALWILGERKASEPASIRVDQAWQIYLDEHASKKVVAHERLDYAWKQLEKHFGRRELGELQTRDFIDYEKKRRGEGVSSATVRRELSALATAFNHLVKTKRINSTDVPYMVLPEASPPRDRWLTVEELERLLKTAETRRLKGQAPKRLSRVEIFTHIAARTGARKRSIERLTWAQVDLDRRMIDFNPPGARQSKKFRPVVPIADALQPILERAHAERTGPLWVLGRSGSVRKGFDALVTAAGLEGVTAHTLRHTWATHAVMAGVPLIDVARVLGNSVPMVVKVYAKYAPEYLRTAVNFTPVDYSRIRA